MARTVSRAARGRCLVMPTSPRGFRRRSLRLSSLALIFAVGAPAAPARADFARPPEPSPYQPGDGDPPRMPLEYRDERDEAWSPSSLGSTPSTVRFHVGPALLAAPAGPGLLTALDVGQRAVGARLSASWLRPQSDRGLAAYTAELWIDFRHRHALHPILGAGASWLHGGAVSGSGNVGAGVLRGALEYELPIEEADARLGADLLAFVPAIGTERSRPWAVAALTVGVGF